jgi:ankyrin repeat protein
MDMISNDLNEFLDGLEKLLEEGDPAALDSVIAIQCTTPEIRNAVLVDALVLSCAGRYLNMVKHLLAEYGLDPNATSQTIDELRGQPPLILAAKCVDWISMQLESNIDSQVETIVQLFRHGARLSCPSRLGKTALSYVTHVRVADALLACEDAEDLQKALAQKDNEDERDALLQALGKDGDDPFNTQYALQLIERGANIHTVDKWGSTALMLAVMNNHLLVVSMLARNDDLMLAKTADHMNIWHLVTAHKESSGDPAIIDILLSRHAIIDTGVDEIDKRGYTCFHYSAESGMTNALVKALAHRHKESLEVAEPNEGLTPVTSRRKSRQHRACRNNT